MHAHTPTFHIYTHIHAHVQTYIIYSINIIFSVDKYGKLTEGPVLKSLQGPLPSNKLQSYHYVHYSGEAVNPSKSKLTRLLKL